MTSALFSSLEGSWNFHRIILNTGEITGIAHFKKIDPGLLHYREDGKLLLKNQTYTVYRDYLYKFQDETISVYFLETPPRLFHTLEFLNVKEATAKHLCREDIYDASYEFRDSDAFQLTYSIQGPKKNMLIATNFVR